MEIKKHQTVLFRSVHKDVIQGINYLKTNNRYFAISKVSHK